MSKKVLVILIMLLMTTSVFAQAGAGGQAKKAGGEKKAATAGSAEQTLIDIENKWIQAGKKQDPAMLEPYLADGFMAMGSDGAYTNKTEYLAGLKKAKWEISEVRNMKAYVAGNRAIVTGDWRGKGMDPNGKAVDTTEHWIDTFAKSPSGKWQCTSDASATAK